ncbi:hypothetical protein BBOV_III004950 [Babesia bovis T2Bo]|uniref:6-Cys domain-containing protein n=1 Tax=Babesia bovis TaxID=5865 RepID=A7ANC4_BABBO|nr:hypothetical protein BBOV_III004950 [Babesia bovis T2Bo]EDO08058.1 hypothetical protein BBOV_III004950 [Babesia bovis T2Bo]|eukprot:XP_001611626.1 hypothetical protein [Babesia bovis T2Bo]
MVILRLLSTIAILLTYVVSIRTDPMPIVNERYNGVYKSLQTKGSVGKRIARFVTNINKDRPVFHVVELDLYRGESITITCPNREDTLDGFFPADPRAYYISPPIAASFLGVMTFSKKDLNNDLMVFSNDKLGYLDDVSDALMQIPYGKKSRRISFLWNGSKVKIPSTLHYICLKESKIPERYGPVALIAIRVIPEKPLIQDALIDINNLVYAPSNHDVIYTKEFSAIDKLTVQCTTKDAKEVFDKWKPSDIEMLSHNMLSKKVDDTNVLNPDWAESISMINANITLDDIDHGILGIESLSLSSMVYILRDQFYLTCTSGYRNSDRVFHLVPNTVTTIENIRPTIKRNPIEESPDGYNDIQHYQYRVAHARAVAIFCPMETHMLQPIALLTKAKKRFFREVNLNFPSTRISTRGDSLFVVDFSNSSAIDDVKLQISCQSKTPEYTSYMFTLNNKMACIFGDDIQFWRPCKVVLFPSDQLIIKCPRKTEKESLPLKPDDVRDAYIRVNDKFVLDRHAAIKRTVDTHANEEIHKITFKGHDNRALIRDEIQYECGEHERTDFSTTENRPIIIIKLVGKFEETDLSGTLLIPFNDMLKPIDGPRLFHTFLGGGMNQKINCSDFFIDKPEAFLYPNNRWEAFDDIPPFFSGMLIDRIAGKKVHSNRAIYGLTIEKYPEEKPSHVTMTLSNDYRMSSRSDNAFYFICARGPLWDDMHSDVAVIQVYIEGNANRNYGVGVQSGLFRVNYKYGKGEYNDATFRISDHEVLAMHCPKAATDKNLPECKIVEPKTFVQNPNEDGLTALDETIRRGMVEYRNNYGIQSLWYIYTEILKSASKYYPIEVECYCRSEDNVILAVMHLASTAKAIISKIMISCISIIITTIVLI